MLIDEVHVFIKAGNGGRGMVHMYRDKMRPKGGPDGGDGGDGGDVIFKAVSDISALNIFRHQTKFIAENGFPGGKNQMTGHNGADLTLEIPIGSVIKFDDGTEKELTHVDQTFLVAKGGKGGHGNYHYRSSTNQQPDQFQPGQPTEVINIFIQLKLIADIGLVGLPNAGKTSLLNELTPAHAKVADYPFTTLEPNLGVTKGGRIIADIPGLIEGASTGKGLGFKFLKHIERTQIIVHCLACDSPNPLADYKKIRTELENYSSILVSKPEIIVLTKSDLLDNPKDIAKLKKLTKATLATSIIDPDSIKKLNDLIAKRLK
ncbi:MAG: GTPase ObgE [Candidatus Shapirobacteria bacterium]|nr:GTPase ObgE [Candidatus Shapirobacteria bacterium]